MPARDEAGVRYKVLEVAPVDAASLEACLNHWVEKGYALDGMHFVVADTSRRPTMAFVLFTQRTL